MFRAIFPLRTIYDPRRPEELKRRMKKLRYLNWPEIARETTQDRILAESKQMWPRDKRNILQAAREQDEIAKRLSSRYHGQWSGEVIRYSRKYRYSLSMPQ